MPKLIHRSMPVKKEKEIETLKATVDKQAAVIDYIAMMADVDITEEEPEMEGVDINE